MITIVIPVRDREYIVGRTLESLTKQTFRPLDVVLVDNGSTDGTLQVLKKWQRDNEADDFRITVINEPRVGATIARNTGLATVKTLWTLFFDSDDAMAPGHVQLAMAAAQAHPQADIIGWDVNLHDGFGKKAVKQFYDKDMMYHCIMHGGMATQRYMAKTELYRRVGAWDETVHYWNDIEMGTRLLMANPKVVKAGCPLPTVNVYFTEQSITGADFRHRAVDAMHSLDCMERNVDAKGRRYVTARRAILAGKCRMEERLTEQPGHVAPAELMSYTMQGQSWIRRQVLWLLYRYTSLGLRGAARVFKPLI